MSILTWIGVSESPGLQWGLFAVIGVAALFVLQSPLRGFMRMAKGSRDSADSLVGEVATVLSEVAVQGAGKAELHGSTWTVRNAGETPLTKGQRSRVVRVDGLTLWVQAESSIQEEHHVG